MAGDSLPVPDTVLEHTGERIAAFQAAGDADQMVFDACLRRARIRRADLA